MNRQGFFFSAVAGVAMSALLGAASAAAGGIPRSDALEGTYCWEVEPVIGLDAFLTLTFLRIGNGNALFSGTAVRLDGRSPDRVLQFSGSSSRHKFRGDNDTVIDRHLLAAEYSFSKLNNLDPAQAFDETGNPLVGHYAIRLDARTLDGRFEGNDTGYNWIEPPLTGPAATFTAEPGGLGNDRNDYAVIPNNYLGGMLCDGTVPGFDNCGTFIPVNNTGPLKLVGIGARQCRALNPFGDLSGGGDDDDDD